MNLSEEQSKFVEIARKGKNILVDACIGSGKTTAIQALCKELPRDKKILYLTYNKLLKIDVKSKIHEKNVLVTNYHGFAYMHLIRMGVKAGISDLIQRFINTKPNIAQYDVLIIDVDSGINAFIYEKSCFIYASGISSAESMLIC